MREMNVKCFFRKLALVGIISNSLLFQLRQRCAVFFRLIRLTVLLSLSELKKKRICEVLLVFEAVGDGSLKYLYQALKFPKSFLITSTATRLSSHFTLPLSGTLFQSLFVLLIALCLSTCLLLFPRKACKKTTWGLVGLL